MTSLVKSTEDSDVTNKQHGGVPVPQQEISNISNVTNFNQAQNLPILTHMYFSHSNVTINYNFGSQTPQ